MCGICGELRFDGKDPDLAVIGRMMDRLAAASQEDVKRTVTIKGKTVEIVEKYMKGESYSDTVAYLVEMAAEMTQRKIWVPDYPQFTGAIGAAILAMQRHV